MNLLQMTGVWTTSLRAGSRTQTQTRTCASVLTANSAIAAKTRYQLNSENLPDFDKTRNHGDHRRLCCTFRENAQNRDDPEVVKTKKGTEIRVLTKNPTFQDGKQSTKTAISGRTTIGHSSTTRKFDQNYSVQQKIIKERFFPNPKTQEIRTEETFPRPKIQLFEYKAKQPLFGRPRYARESGNPDARTCARPLSRPSNSQNRSQIQRFSVDLCIFEQISEFRE